MSRLISLVVAVTLTTTALLTSVTTLAQDKAADPYQGLKWRNIGPGFMSGRIADIAWDPSDSSVWYVAVGSGGVWKTHNAGVTWTPIFDDQPTYSIGSVAVDPSNPHTVWVGTGENVGGRHVGYGDGIYRSEDGGTTWTNMGLSESQHLGTIIIHPTDSDTLWVAAQGPLWNIGGERGLYMTSDGGEIGRAPALQARAAGVPSRGLTTVNCPWLTPNSAANANSEGSAAPAFQRPSAIREVKASRT